jgi:hypothetical protein
LFTCSSAWRPGDGHTIAAAGTFLIGGGIYVVLWLYGFLLDNDSAANVLLINIADN